MFLDMNNFYEDDYNMYFENHSTCLRRSHIARGAGSITATIRCGDKNNPKGDSALTHRRL